MQKRRMPSSRIERLRQPHIEPDREGLGESGGTRSGCRPNSASMAITALVPQTSGATGKVMVAEQQPQVVPLLAMWPISGNTTLVRNFQGSLQTFSYLLRDKNPHNHTTSCARNGSAGVLNGKPIPFQDL